jgi:flavin reductase (DIM6/NTAB) family NADH-FMN oxidoreductase RutF
MDTSIRRKALRAISYGVYIVSAKSKKGFSASIVTWLSQASFDPPLIMMGLKKSGRIDTHISESGCFVINIVGQNQKEFAASFLKNSVVQGNSINGYAFREGKTGAPIFELVPYYLECKVKEIITGTDHDVIMAEIIDAGGPADQDQLDLRTAGWKYGG